MLKHAELWDFKVSGCLKHTKLNQHSFFLIIIILIIITHGHNSSALLGSKLWTYQFIHTYSISSLSVYRRALCLKTLIISIFSHHKKVLGTVAVDKLTQKRIHYVMIWQLKSK